MGGVFPLCGARVPVPPGGVARGARVSPVKTLDTA